MLKFKEQLMNFINSFFYKLKSLSNEKFYLQPRLILFLLYIIFLSIIVHVTIACPDDLQLEGLFSNFSIKYLFGINGRVVPIFIAGLLTSKSLIIWKVCTPFFFVLLVYSISKMIIGANKDYIKNTSEIILFVSLTFFYLYPLVLTSSMFWLAGSYVYLWPVSLGFYSFLHFIKYSNNEKIKTLNIVLFLFSAFYAAFAQEQISVLLSSFSILFIFYFFIIKRKRFNKYLLLQTIIYISGTLLLLLSPSNHLRFQSDIMTWYPEFSNLSFWDKLFRGCLWLIDQLFNKEKFIVIIILILLFIYNLRFNISKFKKNVINISIVLPLSILLLSCLPLEAILDKLAREIPHFQRGIFKFSFDSWIKEFISFNIYNYSFSKPFEFIHFAFWLFYMIYLPLITFFVGKERLFKIIALLIIVAGLFSSSIMFFAPSIYVSAHRVFFAMDVLLVLFCGLLYNKTIIINNNSRFKFLIFYAIYPTMLYITLQWIWRVRYFILY
jgi:hypothetical protein